MGKYNKSECPQCGGNIEWPLEGLGQQVPCPHCASPITLVGQPSRSSRALRLLILAFCFLAIPCSLVFIAVRKPQPTRNTISVAIRQVGEAQPIDPPIDSRMDVEGKTQEYLEDVQAKRQEYTKALARFDAATVVYDEFPVRSAVAQHAKEVAITRAELEAVKRAESLVGARRKLLSWQIAIDRKCRRDATEATIDRRRKLAELEQREKSQPKRIKIRNIIYPPMLHTNSKNHGTEVLTNWVPIVFEVRNESSRYVERAEFSVVFVDTWDQEVTRSYVSIRFNNGGGLKPYHTAVVETDAFNYCEDKIAYWGAGNYFHVEIKMPDGAEQNATEFFDLTLVGQNGKGSKRPLLVLETRAESR